MNSLATAEAVRAACLRTLLEAHEDAGLRGLCAAGRWETAVQAVRRLDLRPVVAAVTVDPPPRP